MLEKELKIRFDSGSLKAATVTPAFMVEGWSLVVKDSAGNDHAVTLKRGGERVLKSVSLNKSEVFRAGLKTLEVDYMTYHKLNELKETLKVDNWNEALDVIANFAQSYSRGGRIKNEEKKFLKGLLGIKLMMDFEEFKLALTEDSGAHLC